MARDIGTQALGRVTRRGGDGVDEVRCAGQAGGGGVREEERRRAGRAADGAGDAEGRLARGRRDAHTRARASRSSATTSRGPDGARPAVRR